MLYDVQKISDKELVHGAISLENLVETEDHDKEVKWVFTNYGRAVKDSDTDSLMARGYFKDGAERQRVVALICQLLPEEMENPVFNDLIQKIKFSSARWIEINQHRWFDDVKKEFGEFREEGQAPEETAK